MKKINIISIALLSIVSLTGCSMLNPDIVDIKKLQPQASHSPSPSPSLEPEVEKNEPVAEQKGDSEEIAYEDIKYEDIKDVDIDLMLKEYTEPKVYQVFSNDKKQIASGVTVGLNFIDKVNNYEGFYMPRNAGDDAKFLAKKDIRATLNDKAFEIFNETIKTDGRMTFVPSANLDGTICFCDGTPRTKINAVPKGTYDMPILVAGKSSQGLDRLVINVDRTVVFKGVKNAPNLQQNIKQYVFLAQEGKKWKVSGMGFNTVGKSRVVE